MSEPTTDIPLGPYRDTSEAPLDINPPDRLQAFTNQVKLNEGVQFLQSGVDFLIDHSVATHNQINPPDPTFNPLAPENIKGMEQYAETLVEARSKADFDRMTMDIHRREAMRAQIDRDGNWMTGLAAAVLDPINLIPIPAIKGMTAMRAAMTLGGSNAALSVGAQYLGTKLDPTASMDHWEANAFYAGLFGGALGGLLAREGKSLAHEYAGRFMDDVAGLDKKLGGITLEEPKPVHETASSLVSRETSAFETPKIGETGVPKVDVKEFQVRETGPEGMGLAKAPFGLEGLFSWMTPLNRLISSGFAGLGELAQAIAGDFGVKTTANAANIASPASALLRSGRFPAIVIDIDQQFRSMWNEYRGHANGWKVGALDVTAAGTMIADKTRDLRGAPNPNGFMSFGEWKTAVFKARAGGIMPEGIDPNAFKSIERALPIVDGFFTEMGKEAVQTGVIKSQEYVRRQAENWQTRYAKQMDRQLELENIPIRSASEEAQLFYYRRSTSEMHDRLQRLEHQHLATDADLGKIIDDIMTKGEERKANARTTVDSMRAEIATYYETQLGIMNELEARSQNGRGLTDKQFQYLQDLRKQFGTGEPNAFRDVVDASNLGGVEFKTAKGSVYSVAEDGTTIRNKAARTDAGHEGDVGIKDKSLKTVYLSEEEARRLDVPQGNWRVIDHEDGTLSLATQREDGTWGISPSQRNVPYTTVPEVGKRPLELWNAELTNNTPSFKKVHFGNEIVEVTPSRQPSKQSNVANDNVLSGTEAQRSFMNKLEDIAAGPALSQMQRNYVDGILNKIMRGDMEVRPPKNDPNYIHRIWDIERVRADEAGPQKLRGIFTDHYRTQQLGDAEERAMHSVQAIINHSNQWDVIEALADKPKSVRPSSVNAREFDIPNIAVADFINTDISDVMHNYARQTGTAIEYSRQFGGDPLAVDKIHDALIQAAAESKGRSAEAIIAKLETHRDDLEFLRDGALHRLRSGDPLTVSQVGIRTAKSWVSSTTMGSTVFTAVIEAARTIGTRGISVFANTFEMLGNMPALNELTQTQRLLTKEGLDLAAGMNSKYMEHNANGQRPGSKSAQAFDKATGGFNNFVESHFYVLNGLSYLTDLLKTHAMIMSSHYMIDDIMKVAAGEATAKTSSLLASYGIDEAIAKRMMDQNAFDKAGRLNISNLSAFTDPELTSIYSTAIAGETRRTVITPSLGDKSMLQQGFVGRGADRRDAPLMTLPFQFMAWGIAANNKLLLSGLQGRDQNFWAGALGMTGVAYLSNTLRGGGAWAQMDMQDRLVLSFEQSGVLAQFSDLNSMIESASGNQFGARPMMGLQPKWGREADGSELYTLPFGAAGSKAYDIYKAFADPYATQTEQFSVMRRSVPLSNLFWLDGTAKALQKGAENW